ncbi:hypothetical protein GCM10010495_63960 [Kitasatospora herbaricolor]|uniref:DUF2637 domain-containing protein n=1 Tax=Kitasatospora herbaricolor TaxID=68217 RepID=UPI00174A7C5F|nr:DUF2637 domain-containing protein [Kitasatospora herbaricolor]MDQ0308432.1 hypothetical protein [Kitasatospora herbaricolor]GGV37894.1 hypothetical protein GCM10010495_63960 [Kitasatospora herbaricolor]
MARPSLTRAHRALLGLVAAGAFLISGIGFAGSYSAVRDLATEKGFGAFAYAFPIGVDAGIVVLLALDLVLTWLRIPFPLLRQTAWLLTVATIAFNAAASWGDPLGMGMHAVIPVLFVVVVEASRHAVGRIAAITADRHMESVRLMRWMLSPIPTFRLWRRMKLWELRSYDEVVRLEQNRLVYRAQLRFRYGRGWRRAAPIQALLPLKLAKYGVPLDLEVLDRLEEEAEQAAHARESRTVAAASVAQAAISAPAPAAAQASPPAARQVPVQQMPGQQLPPQQAQAPAEGGPAGPAAAPASVVSAELAVPTLAKLAAVRLRDAQEPAQAEEQAPARDELNVWTERAVRTHAPQGGMDATGRVPGQASPWFKPPRPSAQPGPEVRVAAPAAERGPVPAFMYRQSGPGGRDVAPGQAVGGQPEQGVPLHQGESGPGPGQRDAVRQEQGVREQAVREHAVRENAGSEPIPQPDRLDPEQCFEALVSYIDTYGQQPDQRRLAEYLTVEYHVVGNRPDGSVSPSQLDKIWPDLHARYASAGRD